MSEATDDERPESVGSYLEDALVRRDTHAFAHCNWDLVAADFDADRFVGYSGAGGACWRVAFPSLESYRDLWLTEARELSGLAPPAEIERQILACCNIAEVDVQGDYGVARKIFRGSLCFGDDVIPQMWQSYYFVRREGSVWLITGFVGYIPED